MKLHTKLTLALLTTLLVITVASQVYQYANHMRLMRKVADQNTKLLEDREWMNADNVYLSAQQAIKGSLERGEMEKFTRMLEAQKGINGLLEFSLFDKEGKVTQSSHASFLKRLLPADLKTRLLTNPEKVTRRTADAFEIYQPQKIVGDCIRCHTTWKEGGVGGIICFRFSTATLEQSRQQWAQSLAEVRAAGLLHGTATTLGIILVVMVLVYLLVKKMVAAPLDEIAHMLTKGSEEVHGAAASVAASSHTLAEGASEQAASLEETSSSLEEMSSMTKRNADSAQKAKELANQTRGAAETGAQNMLAMNNSIGAIRSSSEEMRQAMDAVKGSNDEVAKIIKTIDEIAFQTNILALNAAVEAARAGEAGMGFAVVADEVRNLAQKSAGAARETAAKIEGAIQRTEVGVRVSEKVVDSLKAVLTQSKQVEESLQGIVHKAREVDGLVAEIAASSAEQSQGIEQVNTAVTQMDKVTQSNAANAEESASASEELNAQAEALTETVSRLLAVIGGHTAQKPAARAHETASDKMPGPLSYEEKAAAKTKTSPVIEPMRGRGDVAPGKPVQGKSDPKLDNLKDF